jgi:predicted short-subunit dehydrogenase-like oxidoreductase (DUF2520 family)
MGRLGTALAERLAQAGYRVSKITSRKISGPFPADVLWLCVPDQQIARAARGFARLNCQGKLAFHSSGVLTSDVLEPMRRAGAAVASVHPLMTFVKRSVPDLAGVPFAIEGDQPATRRAVKMVRDLAGAPFAIGKKDKVAYHAFATIICPLLVSLLATAEDAASLAGIPTRVARRMMLPIVRQTIRNCETFGPAGSFSGPIVRGDVATVRAHLLQLRKRPAVGAVYSALIKSALEYLPARNKRDLLRLLTKPLSPIQRRSRIPGAKLKP